MLRRRFSVSIRCHARRAGEGAARGASAPGGGYVMENPVSVCRRVWLLLDAAPFHSGPRLFRFRDDPIHLALNLRDARQLQLKLFDDLLHLGAESGDVSGVVARRASRALRTLRPGGSGFTGFAGLAGLAAKPAWASLRRRSARVFRGHLLRRRDLSSSSSPIGYGRGCFYAVAWPHGRTRTGGSVKRSPARPFTSRLWSERSVIQMRATDE